MTTEYKFQDAFVALMRSHGAHVVSVIGGIYQSGQPDLDVTSREGNMMKVELKYYRLLRIPDFADMMGLLKGPQRNVIPMQLWKRNAACLIIAQLGFDPDKVCILFKQKITFDSVTNCAKILAHSTPCSRPYMDIN